MNFRVNGVFYCILVKCLVIYINRSLNSWEFFAWTSKPIPGTSLCMGNALMYHKSTGHSVFSWWFFNFNLFLIQFWTYNLSIVFYKMSINSLYFYVFARPLWSIHCIDHHILNTRDHGYSVSVVTFCSNNHKQLLLLCNYWLVLLNH